MGGDGQMVHPITCQVFFSFFKVPALIQTFHGRFFQMVLRDRPSGPSCYLHLPIVAEQPLHGNAKHITNSASLVIFPGISPHDALLLYNIKS